MFGWLDGSSSTSGGGIVGSIVVVVVVSVFVFLVIAIFIGLFIRLSLIIIIIVIVVTVFVIVVIVRIFKNVIKERISKMDIAAFSVPTTATTN